MTGAQIIDGHSRLRDVLFLNDALHLLRIDVAIVLRALVKHVLIFELEIRLLLVVSCFGLKRSAPAIPTCACQLEHRLKFCTELLNRCSFFKLLLHLLESIKQLGALCVKAFSSLWWALHLRLQNKVLQNHVSSVQRVIHVGPSSLITLLVIEVSQITGCLLVWVRLSGGPRRYRSSSINRLLKLNHLIDVYPGAVVRLEALILRQQ